MKDLIIPEDFSITNYGMSNEDRANANVKNLLEELQAKREFWRQAFSVPTPESEVYMRKGAEDDSGNSIYYEHIKDSYTLRMLNYLYPGWSQEGMKLEFFPEIRTFTTTGYLVVSYPTRTGMETRRVWAVGGDFVKKKKNTNPPEPTQPDDSCKASETDWIKRAGKKLGIGIDIYEQTIPDEYKAEYEERVKQWPQREYIDALVSQIKSKKTFKEQILDRLPTITQTNRAFTIIEAVPTIKADKFWLEWQKHSVQTAENLLIQFEKRFEAEIKAFKSNNTN